MESINELYNYLNYLSKTVRQCWNIPEDDKQDIIHDSAISLFKKYKEGKIVDNFQETKNYCFITIRNYCTQFKTKLKPEYRDDIFELNDKKLYEIEDDRYTLDKYRRMAEIIIKNNKYKDIEREWFELSMNNEINADIAKRFDLTIEQVGRIQSSVRRKLRTDIRKGIKYLIKNKNDDTFIYPILKVYEIREFFKDLSQRKLHSMLYDNHVLPNGYYIETLIKYKRKKRIK